METIIFSFSSAPRPFFTPSVSHRFSPLLLPSFLHPPTLHFFSVSFPFHLLKPFCPFLPLFFGQNLFLCALVFSSIFRLSPLSLPPPPPLSQCVPGPAPNVWLSCKNHRRHTPHPDPAPRPPRPLVQLPTDCLHPPPEQDIRPSVQGV